MYSMSSVQDQRGHRVFGDLTMIVRNQPARVKLYALAEPYLGPCIMLIWRYLHAMMHRISKRLPAGNENWNRIDPEGPCQHLPPPPILIFFVSEMPHLATFPFPSHDHPNLT